MWSACTPGGGSIEGGRIGGEVNKLDANSRGSNMLVDEWSRTRRGAEIIGHAETGSLFLEAVECIIAVGCGFTERRWCRLNEQASLLRCCWARERVVEVVLQLIELTGIVIPSGERRTGEKGEKGKRDAEKGVPMTLKGGPIITIYISI